MRPLTKIRTDGVVGDVQGVDGDVVDAFGDAEAEQGQGDGHQDLERVEVHDHAQDLQDVAVGVLDEVEFGGAGPFGVADGHVADVVLVGQERDGDRGDAGEPGGQQPQVGQRDLAAERAQPGVQVGDLVVGQPLGEFADEPLGRDAQQFVAAFLAGPGADDLGGVGVVLQHRDQFGDPLVGVGHVGVGPDHDLAPGVLGADPPDRA